MKPLISIKTHPFMRSFFVLAVGSAIILSANLNAANISMTASDGSGATSFNAAGK